MISKLTPFNCKLLADREQAESVMLLFYHCFDILQSLNCLQVVKDQVPIFEATEIKTLHTLTENWLFHSMQLLFCRTVIQ